MNIHSLGSRNDNVMGKYRNNGPNTQHTFSQILEQSAQEKVVPENSRSLASAKSASTYSAKSSEEITFSSNYKECLEQLRELNAQTDWESMSDVEKVKTFEERYRKAFGGAKIFLTGELYSRYSDKDYEINTSYGSELQKYFGSQGQVKLEKSYEECYREAFYNGISDEEMRAAIREKYNGTGAMDDKFAIQREYERCGVDMGMADELVKIQIGYEIANKAEHALRPWAMASGLPASKHPQFNELYMTYAKGVGDGAGFKPNWTQIVQAAKDSLTSNSENGGKNALTPAQLEKFKNMLDEYLNEALGK